MSRQRSVGFLKSKLPKLPSGKTINTEDVDAVAKEMILYMRLQHLLERGNLEFGGVDTEILEVLVQSFGLQQKKLPEIKNQLAEDLMRYCQASPSILATEYADANLGLDADLVLEQWSVDNKVLSIAHKDYYSGDGMRVRRTSRLAGDRSVPREFGYILRYYENILFVHFRLGGYSSSLWEVTIEGKNGYKFLETFQAELARYELTQCLERCKGKVIDINLKELEINLYQRHDLIYPPELQEDIDGLVTSFRNWLHDDFVRQWGYMLIGAPGTGKTSVGGLLAAMREEATFFYCPAQEIHDIATLNRIFYEAKIMSPIVLQIDDVDLIAGKRKSSEYKELTSGLMEHLGGLEKSGKIFLLLTTNDPGGIEEAIIDRAGRVCNKIVFTGYANCIPELIEHFARKFQLKLTRNIVDTVVKCHQEKAAVFTPDETRNLCERLRLLGGARMDITGEVLERALLKTHALFHQNPSRWNLPRQDSKSKRSKKSNLDVLGIDVL